RRRPAAVPQRTNRGADRPRPPRPAAALARYGNAAGRGHALRRRGAPPAARTPRCPPRDGAHASDPGAPRVDRPPRRARSGLRPAARARPRAPIPPRGAPLVRASVHGRAGGGGIAAPGRPRGRARTRALGTRPPLPFTGFPIPTRR